LYLIEQVLVADYTTKTIAKVVLFVGIPSVYSALMKNSSIRGIIRLIKVEINTLKYGLTLGLISFASIFAGYFVLGKYIDFNGIVQELGSMSGITASNFIFTGLYITFGNSFLEEFFFRGFIFLNLFYRGSKKFAYIYSSLLFGIYHIAIFKTWSSPALTALALLGLVSVGMVFNRLDTKTGNFMNSWLVHILADSAIIIIGMKMFNII
ncbi:MAG TPA: CPBP family intramembrane glutamic endopeptidase, partial [Clostridia bacterium]|nr:CPBP family intramembrane glutamic endopeptidase [Clostridia bacterium]